MYNKNFKNLFAMNVLILSIIPFGIGCGQSNPVQSFITNIALNTSTDTSNDEWVQVKASLNTGGFTLAGINVPIENPAHPSIEYGQLTLSPNFFTGGSHGGDLTIALNITEISSINGVNPLLPNGTPLPVGGLQNADIIALPVSTTGAMIYFAFGPGVAMLGTAVPFAALDPAGKYVPGVDVFEPLKIGPVSLIAGLFAGAQTNTTGIGFFIDLSQVINNTPPSSKMRFMTQASSVAPQSNLIFKAVEPAPSVKNRFLQQIYQLSNQGITLQLR